MPLMFLAVYFIRIRKESMSLKICVNESLTMKFKETKKGKI
jgi:hypothetical protein